MEKSRCRKCKKTFDLSCVLCKNQAEPTQPHHRFDKVFGIENGDVRWDGEKTANASGKKREKEFEASTSESGKESFVS